MSRGIKPGDLIEMYVKAKGPMIVSLNYWHCSISKCVPVCVYSMGTFVGSNSSSRGFRATSFLFSSPHPSCQRCHQRAGGSRWLCVKLCSHAEFKCTFSVCPCAGHRALVPDEKRFFFCQPPVWVGCCVNVSIDVRRVNCYTCQRFRSHRVFAFTRCPAALRWSSFLWGYLTSSLGLRWPTTYWDW